MCLTARGPAEQGCSADLICETNVCGQDFECCSTTYGWDSICVGMLYIYMIKFTIIYMQ